MKNLFLFLSILLTPIFSSAGDDPFQGVIKYEVSYEGEGAEYMQVVGFTSYQYTFGDKKVRLKLSGGMAYLLNDLIVDQVTNKNVMIDDDNKIVYEFNEDLVEEAGTEEEQEDGVVVKTKDKEKIMGYKCTKYEVTNQTESGEMITEYWTTTKINVNSNPNIDLVNGLSYPGVEGFPLRIVIKMDGLIMTQEANSVTPYSPSESVFEIPSDYEVKDFSESPLMQLAEEGEEDE